VWPADEAEDEECQVKPSQVMSSRAKSSQVVSRPMKERMKSGMITDL
jgi:hypothetical protein